MNEVTKINECFVVRVAWLLTPEFLSDVMITAFDAQYGGCWYWASPNEREGAPDWLKIKSSPGVGPGNIDLDALWVEVSIIDSAEADSNADRPDPNGDTYLVTHETLANGINDLLNGADDDITESDSPLVSAIMELDAGEIDANLADSIVQHGIFGEEIYG